MEGFQRLGVQPLQGGPPGQRPQSVLKLVGHGVRREDVTPTPGLLPPAPCWTEDQEEEEGEAGGPG